MACKLIKLLKVLCRQTTISRVTRSIQTTHMRRSGLIRTRITMTSSAIFASMTTMMKETRSSFAIIALLPFTRPATEASSSVRFLKANGIVPGAES